MIPGGNHKHKKISFRKFTIGFYYRLNQGLWGSLYFYIWAEIFNLFSIKGFKLSSPDLCCPICNTKSKSFIHFAKTNRITWNSACPNCDSRSRHRGLIYLYKDFLKSLRGGKILHFAPEKIFKKELSSLNNFVYHTTDYSMQDVTFKNENLMKLNFENASYDLILINHVLEHVKDDNMAIYEISRVLNNGGIAIITIPINLRYNKTKNFSDIDSNGHYRDYGRDVVFLFKKHFSKVKYLNLNIYDNSNNAIKKIEPAFICLK